MNREILFKAKRKDNGEWVEGYYLNIAKINRFICTGKIKLDGVVKGIIAPEMYEIDPDTICQYTGLTDKEIWENDILRNKKGDIGVVQWFEEYTAFMIWNKTKSCVCYLSENDFSKIEVIGNVFDNADLLEVE